MRGRGLTLSRLRDMTTDELVRHIEESQEYLLREHRIGDRLPNPSALDFLYVAELARRNARARRREAE